MLNKKKKSYFKHHNHISEKCRKRTVVSTTGSLFKVMFYYKFVVCIISYAYFYHNITDIFIMNLILMHIEPEDNFILGRKPLWMSFFLSKYWSRKLFKLIVVFKCVVSLLISKISKTLASLNSIIAKLV